MHQTKNVPPHLNETPLKSNLLKIGKNFLWNVFRFKILMENFEKDARLFGKDFVFYKNALDLLFQRHLIINSNIANQNTPRYKAKDLSFEPYLKSIIEEDKVRGRKIELARTHTTHLPSPYPPPPKPTVFYETTAFGPDGNSVDIDNEMIKLSENALRYRATAEFVSSKFEKIKSTLERLRP